ncbi:Transcription factor TFIIIB component B'' [Morus notabilis]|uniref:Transcription factor TFIIIB component B n=1 Tax=Morus notabilis TaxID=981085 RepID=W9RZ72_9ROSA|nr:Transcription factor TFIIIB component B'' [Morus notabilis]
MDPFDDFFGSAPTHARAGGRFQPKVKHRPKKQTVASAPSVVPSDTKERTGGLFSPTLDAGKSVLLTAVVDDRLNIQNGVEESLKKHEDSVSGVPEGVTKDCGSVDAFLQKRGLETTSGVPEGGDGHSGSQAPESEVDLVGLDVDHFIGSGVEPASISVRVSSEQDISASAPSTLPDSIEEKLVTLPTNGLDTGASVQPAAIGKSSTEVDSMQFDVDLFDDILSESTPSSTRAGHKFRTKIKPQAQKGATRGVASSLEKTIESPASPATLPIVDSIQSVQSIEPASPATLPIVDSIQSVQSIDTGNSTPTERIDSSLATSEILGSREPPENGGYPCSNDSVPDNTRNLEVGIHSQPHATDALQSKVSVPDASEDWHSSFGKSLGENVDLFSGLEYLDDFITQTTNGTGSEASKSQCKVDMDVQHGDKFLTPFSINTDLGGSTSPSGMATHSKENFSAPADGSFESSAFTICDVAPSQTLSDFHTTNDPVTFSETVVSDKHEEVHINNGKPETKVSGTSFDFETCDATVPSGKRAGKFQPKPKLGKGKQKPSTSNPQTQVRSSLPSEDAHFVPFDNGYAHGDSISEFLREDILDCSSARFSDPSAIAPTPEIHGDTEPTNLTEATQLDDTVLGNMHSEDDPGVLGKGGKSRMGKDCTEPKYNRKNEKSSTTSQGVEGGKSSMQLRKRRRRLVDEPFDEAYDVNDSTCERPTTSNRDEDEDNDDEYRVDSMPRKRETPRKVKEPVPGNEKPGRKRKSTKEAYNESTKEPPKKFSHSSRRSKRRVEKALLDTPEDEIDPQRLPIKDLILLAEHRERIAIKDAAKLKTPQSYQRCLNSLVEFPFLLAPYFQLSYVLLRAENSFCEDASYNEETFVSEQGQYSDDDQPSYKVQPSSLYNHQSFMKKTPRARWSKQDTELFYEAVRQFGPVFSLIEQLFPGRTREQVKLKFKKEGRQHPLRLSEAITNRRKDHSHFLSVIQRLQQAAAQAKQESDENESIAVTGEEEVEEPADDTNTRERRVADAGNGSGDMSRGGISGPGDELAGQGDELANKELVLGCFNSRATMEEGETKSEWDNEAAKDQEADVAEADNSPLKFDENDDDPDRWGQYIY